MYVNWEKELVNYGRLSLRTVYEFVMGQSYFFLRSSPFWDVTQHRLVFSYQCYNTTYWSHLQRIPRTVEGQLCRELCEWQWSNWKSWTEVMWDDDELRWFCWVLFSLAGAAIAHFLPEVCLLVLARFCATLLGMLDSRLFIGLSLYVVIASM